MTAETIAKPESASAFPAGNVEAKLRELLLASAKSTAEVEGVSLPGTASDQYSAAIQLDSLGVVDLLCDVEPIVGFELHDSVVRAGGYRSINEAISHLMPRIESAWQRHKRKGGKK